MATLEKKTLNWGDLQFRGLVYYHYGGVRWEADMVLEKELILEKELCLDLKATGSELRHCM